MIQMKIFSSLIENVVDSFGRALMGVGRIKKKR